MMKLVRRGTFATNGLYLFVNNEAQIKVFNSARKIFSTVLIVTMTIVPYLSIANYQSVKLNWKLDKSKGYFCVYGTVNL